MTDSIQLFTIFPELALALAGFAGVAATFSGRDRSYDPAEKERLKGLFLIAGSTIIVSISIIALYSAGLTASTVYFWASALALVAQIPMAWLCSSFPELSSNNWR